MLNWLKRLLRYVCTLIGVFAYIGSTAGDHSSDLGRWLYEDMNRWVAGATISFVLAYILADWLLFGSPFWKRLDG